MFRVVVLYEDEPDADSYAEHVRVCERVPGAVFRHGKIFGAAMGEPRYKYYAEWEFADRDAFAVGTRSDEFKASGLDARERELPWPAIEFAELNA